MGTKSPTKIQEEIQTHKEETGEQERFNRKTRISCKYRNYVVEISDYIFRKEKNRRITVEPFLKTLEKLFYQLLNKFKLVLQLFHIFP